MTRIPFQDHVAIDTNVFVHLLNTEENTHSHINKLLVHLWNYCIALVIDDNGRILGEYERIITPVVKNLDENLNERAILLYWILYAERCEVPLDMGDDLMRAIRRVIVESSESVDRIFVYVAFKMGTILITNDDVHIVVGPTRERNQSPRRDRLLHGTRRLCPGGAGILTSQEACDKVG